MTHSFDLRTAYGNFKSNLIFLRETNTLNKNQKILEIGCGLGGLLKYLLDQGYDIRGTEIDTEYLKKSKELYGSLPITLVDSEILPFDDHSFDVVISFDVFEHLHDSDNHLKEVSRVLKDKGFYLLQTPNKYTNILFEIIRHKSLTLWMEDHVSLHTYKEVIRRFNKNRYKIDFLNIPVVTDFFMSKLERYTGKIGLYFLKIINPDNLPISFKTNFYIKAQKL